MILKCYINGNTYQLEQGATFSEEYNETLDSGTIIINNVEKIEGLKPYDDVFIFEENEFKGYGEGILYNGFYKHLLVDQYTEERVNPLLNFYTYKIELFSETKKLETIQLPNISITQPLKMSKKKNVYSYLSDFIDMYSPLKKQLSKNGKEWEFVKKYSLDNMLLNTFYNVYAPDFSLNNPNLRDILTQLMLTKDMIPYVKNDVIYGMDLTQRKREFSLNGITNVVSTMSSDNYCNDLRREYSNALTQENTCNYVEYLGFRNSDESLLTLENMRIETTYPIYKINKIYMCYFKKGDVYNKDNLDSPADYKIFLCKQDITPLVLLNSTRNLLSSDWDNFLPYPPNGIEELAKYKLATVGYDIGSKYITGWGAKYDYPEGWYDKTKTYIQNIVAFMDYRYPFGIYGKNYIVSKLDENQIFMATTNRFEVDTILNRIVSPFTSNGTKLKSFFFEIEYDAFYNGAIIHSKDEFESGIIINDNSDSSLILTEKDGLFQKEKVNRFGNKAYLINARYKNYSELQELGDIYDDDVIIYHREYQIWKNEILAEYYGTKDYVLKNYYNTVYAKHRTYNLMSYSESIKRAENKKTFLLLSTNKCYYENLESGNNILFKNFNDDVIGKILSFYKPNERFEIKGLFTTKDKINYGYFGYDDKYYACDINTFSSGNSLCINLKMYDNVSGGVYIDTIEPELNEDVTEDFTGSIQKWHIASNKETGFAKKMSFNCGHVDKVNYYDDKVLDISAEETVKGDVYNKLFNLPKIDLPNNMSNVIGNEFLLNKDNKELIDMTFQIEIVTNNDNIMFSQWIVKLSDLLSIYYKNDIRYSIKDFESNNYKLEISYSDVYNEVPGAVGGGTNRIYEPYITLKMSKSVFDNLDINNYGMQSFEIFYDDNYDLTITNWLGDATIRYYFKGSKIVGKTSDTITISGEEIITVNKYMFKKNKTFSKSDKKIVFKISSQTAYYYTFCNLYQDSGGWYTWVDKNSQLSYYEDGKEKIASFFGKVTGVRKDTLTYINQTKDGETITYNNNIFYKVHDERIKKSIVYDEFVYVEELLYYDNIITMEKDENGCDVLKVNLTGDYYDFSQKEAISFWYYNGDSYKFVFGINISTINLQVSKVEEKSATRDILFEDSDYDEETKMYKKHLEFTIFNLAPEEEYKVWIFSPPSENYATAFIENEKVDYARGTVSFDISSSDKIAVYIIYFGYQHKYAKIYLSMISSKDLKVYDDKNIVIGESYNYVEGGQNYGESQLVKHYLEDKKENSDEQ